VSRLVLGLGAGFASWEAAAPRAPAGRGRGSMDSWLIRQPVGVAHSSPRTSPPSTRDAQQCTASRSVTSQSAGIDNKTDAFAVMMRSQTKGSLEGRAKRTREGCKVQKQQAGKLHDVKDARREMMGMGFEAAAIDRALKLHAHGTLVDLAVAVAACISSANEQQKTTIEDAASQGTALPGEVSGPGVDEETMQPGERADAPEDEGGADRCSASGTAASLSAPFPHGASSQDRSQWWTQEEQKRFRKAQPLSPSWWEAPLRRNETRQLLGEEKEPQKPLGTPYMRVLDAAKGMALAEGAEGARAWLAPLAISNVPGLFQFHDFISEEEETRLVEALEREGASHWKPSTFNGECHSQGWGVRTDLAKRKVRQNVPAVGERDLPLFLCEVVQRWQKTCSVLANFQPNEANANSYQRDKGHRLTAHFDDRTLSGEVLVNLSLCSSCIMTFEKKGAPPVPVTVPRRSLQVVTGRARYDFTHAIANTDLHAARRVSVTFRKAKLTV